MENTFQNTFLAKQPIVSRVDPNEIFQSVIKASNISAWAYFPEDGFFWGNDIYFSMIGLDLNNFDISGNKNLDEVWLNLMHPDDKANALRTLNGYINNPQDAYENYFRMKHVDGNWVWIWSRGGFVNDENGKRLIGTHVNVTVRKRAEEESQNERILLRTLIDNLPDVIYIKDIEGRKIIANKADVISIGAPSEGDIIGKTDLELFPDNADIAKRGYQDDMDVLRLGKTILNKEEFFIDEGGSKRWLTTSKVPVRDENGNIIRLLGIGHDITDRKLSEETLNKLNIELNQQSEVLSKQARNLQELNNQLTLQKEQELEKAIAQGKFEIASEVLHDIGNALVGFGSHLNRINRAVEQNNLGNIKRLALFLKGQESNIAAAIGADKAAALVTISDGIANTQTENHTEIGSSINELFTIITHIQEILNIQRQFVRGHGGTRDRKPVNLATVIDDCRSMLFASLDKKGIKLKIDIKPGNYVIKGDHTKLMQVMLNVIKNSVEAIDYDSTDKLISITMQANNELIELNVKDSGQGFDEETAKNLFERGFTTKKSGTGLGLYNCKSIVESHTGSFEIKSDGPGTGAVTTIKFGL